MIRWTEYFRDPRNGEAVETSMAALEKPPVYDDDLEIEAGLDRIPAELFKFGGEKIVDHISIR